MVKDKFKEADKHFEDGYRRLQKTPGKNGMEYYMIKGQYTILIDEEIYHYIKEKLGEW